MNGENYLHYKLNLEFYHLIFPNGLDGSPRVPLGPFTGTLQSNMYKVKVVEQDPDRIMEYIVRSNMGYVLKNPFKDNNFLLYTSHPGVRALTWRKGLSCKEPRLITWGATNQNSPKPPNPRCLPCRRK